MAQLAPFKPVLHPSFLPWKSDPAFPALHSIPGVQNRNKNRSVPFIPSRQPGEGGNKGHMVREHVQVTVGDPGTSLSLGLDLAFCTPGCDSNNFLLHRPGPLQNVFIWSHQFPLSLEHESPCFTPEGICGLSSESLCEQQVLELSGVEFL